MTDKKKVDRKKKHEKQKPEEDSFGLDMDFGEALERFLNVDPKEVEEVEQNPPQKPTGGS